MGFLAGKKILITGLLSNRSIAYGIARTAAREGAQLAFSYQNDRFKDRVSEMARELGSETIVPCDVENDAEIDAMMGSCANAGTDWTVLCTRSPLHRASQYPAPLWMD